MTGRELASAVAVLSAMALVVLDAGLLNVALPTIAAAFGATPSGAILTVSAYQTALLMGLLPCAQAAERFGYRRFFVGGLVLFSAASFVCALAPSLPLLVAARVVQGLGGAAILALGIALLRFALGAERLGAAIGWNALNVALCSAVAPVAGAAILSVASWPWLFLAKAPLALLALTAARALPQVEATRPNIDVAAMLLHGSIAALVLFAAESAVARPAAAAALAGAAGALALLLLRRERLRQAPLWPLDLLALRPFRFSVTASICCFSGQTIGLIVLPFYLQRGLGKGALVVGMVMACWPVAVGITGPLASRLAQRFGSAPLCVAGGIVIGAGLLLSALWPLQDDVLPLAAGAALAGLGFGLFQVPNNRAMFLSAPPERSASAGGLQGSARLIGQTAGALAAGTMFACLPIVTAARSGLALGSCLALAAALVSALRSSDPRRG